MPTVIKRISIITCTLILSVFFLSSFSSLTVYAEENDNEDVEDVEEDEEDDGVYEDNIIDNNATNTEDEDEDLNNEQSEKILQVYEDLDDILVIDKGIWYQDILRSTGKGIMLLLAKIVDYLENGVDTLLGQNHFYEQSGVKNLMDKLTPYAFGLFFISLIVLGFQFMWNKIDNRAELIMNIVLAVSVIILVPKMFSVLDDVLQWGLDGVSGEHSISEDVIKTNVADLKLYVDRQFDYADEEDNDYAGDEDILPRPTSRNDISVGTTDFTNGNTLKGTNISVTEKLDIQADEGWFPWTTEEWVSDLKNNNTVGYNFLQYKAVPTADGSTLKLKKLAKNAVPATKIGQESYFRYKLNWGTIFSTLAILGFVLAITVVKVARVMYELAFHGIAVMFVAGSDINGGQRIKKMITEIVSSFAVLFVMVLILKLYTYFTSWALEIKSDIGWLPYILVMIAGAWAVIDAPDIVTRILGIDAGLRSGWQAMAGAYAGSKTAGSIGKGAGKGIAGLGSGVAGGKGLIDGLRGKQPPSASANQGASKINSSGSSSGQGGGGGSPKGNEESSHENPSSNEPTKTENTPQSKSSQGKDEQNKKIPSDNKTQNKKDNKQPPQTPPQEQEGADSKEIPSEKGGSGATPLINNIDDSRNPYETEKGLFGGTRGKRTRTESKARGYNTGARIRNKLKNKFKRIDDDE